MKNLLARSHLWFLIAVAVAWFCLTEATLEAIHAKLDEMGVPRMPSE